jgi:hypothetical protein
MTVSRWILSKCGNADHISSSVSSGASILMGSAPPLRSSAIVGRPIPFKSRSIEQRPGREGRARSRSDRLAFHTVKTRGRSGRRTPAYVDMAARVGTQRSHSSRSCFRGTQPRRSADRTLPRRDSGPSARSPRAGSSFAKAPPPRREPRSCLLVQRGAGGRGRRRTGSVQAPMRRSRDRRRDRARLRGATLGVSIDTDHAEPSRQTSVSSTTSKARRHGRMPSLRRAFVVTLANSGRSSGHYTEPSALQKSVRALF